MALLLNMPKAIFTFSKLLFSSSQLQDMSVSCTFIVETNKNLNNENNNDCSGMKPIKYARLSLMILKKKNDFGYL